MLLAEPQRTAWDVNFQIFGFPVRIHPLFWVVGLVLGYRGDADPIWLLTCLVAVFVSILIHELGHAFLIRRFGRPAHIVLYGMGGLAIEGHDTPHSAWSSFSFEPPRRSRTPTEQIIISFAGPAAGFIFAAIIILLIFATGGKVNLSFRNFIVPLFDVELGGALGTNENLLGLIHVLLYFNIFWGLVNLLPVFPLDGGQIAQQILIVQDPWGGVVKSLWLSIMAAGAAALAGAFLVHDMFIVLLFISLGVSNYLTLQQITGSGGRPW